MKTFLSLLLAFSCIIGGKIVWDHVQIMQVCEAFAFHPSIQVKPGWYKCYIKMPNEDWEVFIDTSVGYVFE